MPKESKRNRTSSFGQPGPRPPKTIIDKAKLNFESPMLLFSMYRVHMRVASDRVQMKNSPGCQRLGDLGS